jgi:hypothetical protein
MADENLKSKVNREVGRINGALCDLKEEEESLRIRRARLEVEMRQAIAMRDMFEVLGRLDDLPPNAFEEYLAKRPPAADKAVRVTVAPVAAPTSPPDDVAELRSLPRPPAHPVDARRKHKPDGLPSIAAMIAAALRETPGLRPPEKERLHFVWQVLRNFVAAPQHFTYRSAHGGSPGYFCVRQPISLVT